MAQNLTVAAVAPYHFCQYQEKFLHMTVLRDFRRSKHGKGDLMNQVSPQVDQQQTPALLFVF